MTLTVKETVKENLNSIGSLEEIKSVYCVLSEHNQYELNNDDEREEVMTTQYDYYVYAESFDEVCEIVRRNLKLFIDETDEVNILEISKVNNIYLELLANIGIIGALIFITYIFYYLKEFKNILVNNNNSIYFLNRFC